ncbi:MAG: NYN domain-containing protein [Patescibacteria group bacterium]
MSEEHKQKLKSVIKDRVVIFIDAANLERSVQSFFVNPKEIPENFKRYYPDQLCWRVDYERFKNFFGGICDLKEIKFYSPDFQTDSHRKFFWFLKKVLKIKLSTKPLKEYSDHSADHPHRKANFDVEISVDATFNLNGYDTLILFSGDSDFEYLLKFLRGQNKRAIVFSRSGHVAKELIPACSHYFDLVDFRNEFLKIDIKKQKISPFSETRGS